MGSTNRVRGRSSRFAVPLSALEEDVRVDPDDMVVEIAEPPNPDAVPAADRRTVPGMGPTALP